MMATTHRFTGAAAGLAVATATGAGLVHAVVTTVIATVTAAGITSPDIDQQRAWRAADALLPDELAGHGGPFRHRGIAHWWGLPVLVGYLAVRTVPMQWQWLVVAALTGWCSHLIGDFVFGKASRYQGRGPGIPLAPWWWHVGFGLDTGGRLEAIVQWLGLPAVVAWQILTLVR
jgi:membrane-bound metal-dependent hydrolase YbcI (DUF457 family)